MAQQECFPGEAVSHHFVRNRKKAQRLGRKATVPLLQTMRRVWGDKPEGRDTMKIKTRAETYKSTGAAATKASWELVGSPQREGLALGLLRGSVPPVFHLLASRGSWVRNISTSEYGIGE